MKKKLIAYITTIMMIGSLVSGVVAFADTEIDSTEPLINSVSKIDNTKLDADTGYAKFEFDLVEDGAGISEIMLGYENSNGKGYAMLSWYSSNNGNELLYTGKRIVEFRLNNYMPAGDYFLDYILITDANGNYKSYDKKKADDVSGDFWDNASFNVASSKWQEETSSSITNISILDTNNLDSSGSFKTNVTVDASAGGPIKYISIYFTNDDESFWNSAEAVIDKPLDSGTHVVEFDMRGLFYKGTYRVAEVAFTSGDVNAEGQVTKTDCPEIFKQTITVTKSPLVKTDKPEIQVLNINNSDIKTPGVMKTHLYIRENGNKIAAIEYLFKNTEGKNVFLTGTLVKGNAISNYYMDVPISPFTIEGELKLDRVDVTYIDVNGYEDWTYFYMKDIPRYKTDKIHIDSEYDLKYFGAVGNLAAVNKIKELKDGETAVLDCRNKKSASSDLFKAIAGRNVTLVFADEDVQWVFNGKDIKAANCKRIDLTSKISVVSGGSYGFSSDKKIALCSFADNGKLPGEVEMRINGAYIKAKYDLDNEDIYVTYISANNNLLVEDTGVALDKDMYYEYETDHNSKFAMSESKAKIGKTEVSSKGAGFSKIKLSWDKTGGNGYYIYRSTSKNGKYKKIATIKKNSTTYYIDKKIKKKKTYYYKVKPYSKYSKLNKTAKISEPYKTNSRIADTTVWTNGSSTKGKIVVGWNKRSDAKKYYVYRSTAKNGNYKKIASTTKIKYYDKNAVKGVKYYYKVKAVHKYSKYSSNLSSAVAGIRTR